MTVDVHEADALDAACASFHRVGIHGRARPADLWHSAARATDDGEGGIRRHVRGGRYGGNRPTRKHGLADFVKNARC